MNVVYLRSFLTDIKNIKDAKLKQRIKDFIIQLENAESLEELPNIKKLSGYSTAYRSRFGDYRLGFYKENDEIQLARFVKRNDIYKVFPND